MVSVCSIVDLIDTFNLWHVMNLLIFECRFMGYFDCKTGLLALLAKEGVMAKSSFGDVKV